MSAHAKEQTQVDTESTDLLIYELAERSLQEFAQKRRSYICAGLARDPENTQVAVVVELNELALVDGTDTELALDGRDQRRTLEERASEELESASELLLTAGDFVVEANNADVLLASALLALDEARSAVDADDQASYMKPRASQLSDSNPRPRLFPLICGMTNQ